MMHSKMWRIGPPVLLFILTFAVYCATLAPTITWAHDGADGGDLITAAYNLGIAHPPGYPTYVLLGKLFTLLPVGDVAFRVNLMSAFFAATTVVLAYLALRLLLTQMEDMTSTVIIAAVSALFLAFSRTFWSQALIAEVYSLNAFFVGLMIYLVTLWWLRSAGGKGGRGGWLLWVASFVFGLGLGNHLSMVLLLPGMLYLVVRRGRREAQTWLGMAAFLLMGLGVYVYLPWRAAQHPPINWGNPSAFSGFWWTVSASIYREYAFGLPLVYLPARLASAANTLAQQFTWPGLALGMAGVWYLWDRQRDYLLFSLASFAATATYAITYNTPDSYVYLIPCFLVFALWIGVGARFVFDDLVYPWLRTRWSSASSRRAGLSVFSAVLLLVPAFLIVGNYSELDLSQDRTAYEYAAEVFSNTPREALIIADTDAHIFALWYFRYVVAPQSSPVVVAKGLVQYPWYRENVRRHHPQVSMPTGRTDPYAEVFSLIDGNMPHRPVYLTDADGVIMARYRYSQVGTMYRLGD